MKKRDFRESLKDKSLDELRADLVASKKELFDLRFRNATNQLDNTARIGRVRKDIARIFTVITKRTKGLAKQEDN